MEDRTMVKYIQLQNQFKQRESYMMHKIDSEAQENSRLYEEYRCFIELHSQLNTEYYQQVQALKQQIKQKKAEKEQFIQYYIERETLDKQYFTTTEMQYKYLSESYQYTIQKLKSDCETLQTSLSEKFKIVTELEDTLNSKHKEQQKELFDERQMLIKRYTYYVTSYGSSVLEQLRVVEAYHKYNELYLKKIEDEQLYQRNALEKLEKEKNSKQSIHKALIREREGVTQQVIKERYEIAKARALMEKYYQK